MIIGICGLIGSGKGTVADILVENYNFQKISFADRLKDAVSELFEWDRSLLEGDTNESREWREQPDTFWTKETGKEITPRLVLQLFGTECMRNGFHDNFWVSLVKKQVLENPNTNFVVPDTRFANEKSMIKSLGGEIWWVKRGELPKWWAQAVMANAVNDTSAMEEYNVHPSEWKWAAPNNKFDKIFYNDSTLEILKSQVEDHLASTLLLPSE